MSTKNYIQAAITAAGGYRKTANLCRVNINTVQKWEKKGRLPLTELAGFTGYAHALQVASGGKIMATQIRAATFKSHLADHKARVKREKRQA
jgi:hypothetical protein